MTERYRDTTRTVSASMAKLKRAEPELMSAFSGLAQAAMRDGALSKKTKELIALALGIAGHCDACIAFHVQALVRLGVGREELEEMLGVTVYMGGGPSLMYATSALRAFEEFSETAAVT